MDKRYGKVKWGPNGTRIVTSPANWRKPLKWNREAEQSGRRFRVFCASLADVFEDRRDLDEPRYALLDLVRETPNLDWLLLTKRPENIDRLSDREWPPYVKVGTTAEDQRVEQRIYDLVTSTMITGDTFVSYEPAIGRLRFDTNLVEWVIFGGESGPGWRPCDLDWGRAMRDECKRTGTAFFMKQVAAFQPTDEMIPEDLRIREWP